MPLIDTCEIFTLADPLFVRVKVCDCCEPVLTLPKASLLGLEPRTPIGFEVPVPESDRVAEVSLASLVTVAVAVKEPAALGENETLTGTLCPAPTVIGMLGEVSVKYLLEKATPLTLTESGPELEAVKVSVLVVPACTLPNCSVAIFNESVVVCCCC